MTCVSELLSTCGILKTYNAQMMFKFQNDYAVCLHWLSNCSVEVLYARYPNV